MTSEFSKKNLHDRERLYVKLKDLQMCGSATSIVRSLRLYFSTRNTISKNPGKRVFQLLAYISFPEFYGYKTSQNLDKKLNCLRRFLILRKVTIFNQENSPNIPYISISLQELNYPRINCHKQQYKQEQLAAYTQVLVVVTIGLAAGDPLWHLVTRRHAWNLAFVSIEY